MLAKVYTKYNQVIIQTGELTQIWLWKQVLRSCKRRGCFVVFCFKTAWNLKSRRWLSHVSCRTSFESMVVHQDTCPLQWKVKKSTSANVCSNYIPDFLTLHLELHWKEKFAEIDKTNVLQLVFPCNHCRLNVPQF